MIEGQFLEALSKTEPGVIPVPPVKLKIGPQDIMAARLLIWLNEQMPPEATMGDLDDVLDSAKWWSTFWGSAFTAAKEILDSDQQ